MPEHIAMPAREQERPPYLRPESLDMSGIERLREASTNVWYLLKNIAPDVSWVEYARHSFDVTPIHEAGHAVAYALAGKQVRDVRLWFFPPRRDGTDGHCRTVEHTSSRTADEFLAAIGRDQFLREVIATFAGPLAELRYNPTRCFGGARQDMIDAEMMLKHLDMSGNGDRYTLHSWAWCMACALILDERVWAAIIEVSDRLKRSSARPCRVSGGAVHSIVRKHLPEGVEWPEAPWEEEGLQYAIAVEAAA